MNLENKNESEINDITKNTVNQLENEILKDTTTEKWVRNCPKCNTIMIYKKASGLFYSTNHNCLCKKCRNINIKPPYIRNCPKCNSIINYKKVYVFINAKNKNTFCKKCTSNLIISPILKSRWKKINGPYQKICPKCNNTIIYSTRKILKNSIKQNSFCKNCQYKYKNHITLWNKTDKAREIFRKRLLKRVKGMGGICNYNPKACRYFDKLNEEKKWNLQHALNGGEIHIIGYSLDGYDKEKNIVIEYDEFLHKYKKEKDLKRQQEIIKHLNCEFYRYDEKEKTLLNVHPFSKPENRSGRAQIAIV